MDWWLKDRGKLSCLARLTMRWVLIAVVVVVVDACAPGAATIADDFEIITRELIIVESSLDNLSLSVRR